MTDNRLIYTCNNFVICFVHAGALLVFFLKPTTKRLALYYAIIIIISSGFTFAFFLRCPTHDIAGITVPYPNR